MKYFGFWKNLTGLTLGKLCRQRMLLAGLALLCFLLPVMLGPVANAALSKGIAFDSLKLAIVAPEDESMQEQLVQILSGMQDLRQYCQIVSMSGEEAEEAMETGEITAALILPENFVSKILNGSNPDVTLLVPQDRPLEALLTLWLGENAADLLSAVQSGVYTVLESYTQNPPEGVSYQDVVARINLRYISWTLNRRDMYRTEEIPVTDHLPIGLHYSLSLFSYLLLSLAPVFWGIFEPRWIRSLNRFRAAGIGPGMGYSAAIAACALPLSALSLILPGVLVRGNILLLLLSALVCGLFCACFTSVFCLLASDTGSCGTLCFAGSLIFLLLSGGVIPPVLMPARLQSWIRFSPVTWLRNILAMAGGYEVPGISLICLGISIPMLLAAGRLLYGHRSRKEEDL